MDDSYELLRKGTKRAYEKIMEKLHIMDIFGILDMCGEPDMSVIEYETDIAVKMYQINRNQYPRYTW